MKRFLSVVVLTGLCSAVTLPAAEQSIARDWNEQCLASIRSDTPHPPAQARNLFSLSAAMYDAWAAYDTVAAGYIYQKKHTAGDLLAARKEAVSYAAYRMLKERYAYSKTASNTWFRLDNHMLSLGYSTNNFSTDTSTPAGVGNSVYLAVSAWFINDGSRQANGVPYPITNSPVAYPDYPAGQGGYSYLNPALITGIPGIDVTDINQWQRLAIANSVDQNGFPQGPIQNYLGPQWLGVRAFSLTRNDVTKPWIDPGPPPFLGSDLDKAFRTNVVEVIRSSSQLTPDDGVMVDISPRAFGNNTLGSNDGTGRALNPFTKVPYAPNVVKRGDFVRILAEFWADGPSSETPPGHWNTLANTVSDSPSTIKQIGGTGPVVDNFEWDVKLYFALNGAVHDAACAAWSLKRYYNAWRPISAIRWMGQLGQSSEPTKPSFNPNGLPLIPDLIELTSSATVGTGKRHQGLPANRVVILAWPGQPADPTNTHSGVRWLLPEGWLPYQKKNFVTPAFPGYISGHSTFSRSAAELLTAFTGSPYFPNGMGTFTAASNSLSFEKGPATPVTLQWATYFDAADQAGLSRIWGGIHPPVDDFTGRRVGSQCGKSVWSLAKQYYDGSVLTAPVNLTLRPVDPSHNMIRFNCVRGMYYKLQSTTSLQEPFVDELALTQATDTTITRTNAAVGNAKFYRVVNLLP